MSFQSLYLKEEYRTGQDNLVSDFYHPCLEKSYLYQRSVGYFSSTVFLLIGPEIIEFAKKGGKIQLICSPSLSTGDIQALERGYSNYEHWVSNEALATIDTLFRDERIIKNTEALATLIKLNVMEVKLAFRKDSVGIYHEKLGIFSGADETLQIQSTDRLLQVGPDTWGLYERDKSLSFDEIGVCLHALYAYLNESGKGIHHSEVDTFLKSKSLVHLKVSGYELLNLAQRDERFYLGRSMFLGLLEWGEDTRRLTVAQAVRLILSEMTARMSINEIHATVENLTGLEVDGTVTGLLPKEGAKYNVVTKLWEKA